MKLRYLIAITLGTFIFQILYSINFSLKIVDENQSYNQNQTKYTELFIKNQELQNLYYQFSSINNIEKIVKEQNLQNISNTINLNN